LRDGKSAASWISIAERVMKRAYFLIACVALAACASAHPGEHDAVRDEATAIAIGRKACAENHADIIKSAEVLMKAPYGPRWHASYENGQWWVQLDVYAFSPGLQIGVWAVSGGPGVCDVVAVVEQ
jgi:hypothetical protein